MAVRLALTSGSQLGRPTSALPLELDPKLIPTALSYPVLFNVFSDLITHEDITEGFSVYDIGTLTIFYFCEGSPFVDFSGIGEDQDHLISIANGGPSCGAQIKIWDRRMGVLLLVFLIVLHSLQVMIGSLDVKSLNLQNRSPKHD